MNRFVLTMAAGALAAVCLTGPLTAQQGNADVALRAAMETETVKGDLRAAIEQYKRVVAEHGKSNRPIAAQALLRMAECCQKLGEPAARTIYRRLSTDFADQKEASVARARLRRTGNEAADAILSQRELLSVEPLAMFPALTADERFFTYFDFQKFVRREIGTGRIHDARSLSETDDVYFPRLSDDQKELAYTLRGGRISRLVIASLDRPSEAPRALMTSSAEIEIMQARAWLPDGNSLIVEMQRRAPDSTWQFARVGRDGTVKVLTNVQWRRSSAPGRWFTSLSRDGRYFAYAALGTNPRTPQPGPSDPTDRHIYVLATDGSTQTQLTTGAGINENPIWSPDGTHILYVGDRAGTFDLWAVPMNGGKPSGPSFIVKRNVGRVVLFAMGASGSVYYMPTPGLGGSSVTLISVLDLSGRASDRPQHVEPVVGDSPAWFPDGTALLFRRADEKGREVVIRSVRDGAERKLPDVRAHGWMRSERHLFEIVHSEMPNDESDPTEGVRSRFARPVKTTIFRIDASSGRREEVRTFASTPRTNVRSHAVSSDGRMVYGLVTSGTPIEARIIAFDLADGTHREMTSLPSRPTALELSPDNRTLAMLFGEDREPGGFGSGVALWPLEGGELKLLYQFSGAARATSLAWAPDGQSLILAVGERTARRRELVSLSLDGSKLNPLGVAMDGVHGLSLSPDGSRIAVNHSTPSVSKVEALTNVGAWLKNRSAGGQSR